MATGSLPEPPRRRVRLLVAYDGTEYHGLAPNVGVRTVLGDLTDAISLVVRSPVQLDAAGRTDAGVHAWGQVVTADLPGETDLDDLVRRLNKLCAPAIAVRRADWVGGDLHARFSATSRTYRYHVWNDPAPNPLGARTSWHVPGALALWAMDAAGDPLVGEHDFTTFCRRPRVEPGAEAPSLVRRVQSLGWRRVDDSALLRFEITASSFCHQMVRTVVGTMVEVGSGRRTPADVVTMLRARDRSMVTSVAPPHGLVLWHVSYDGVRWDAPLPRGK